VGGVPCLSVFVRIFAEVWVRSLERRTVYIGLPRVVELVDAISPLRAVVAEGTFYEMFYYY
jgi:hypothetical protein